MSNKRNRRRKGQRVRAEVSRKPVKITKATSALIAAQPAERERKERVRQRERPTKEARWRRGWITGVNPVRRRERKSRVNYGKTWREHTLDN